MTVPVMDSSGLSWYNWTKADKDHVTCVFNYSTAFLIVTSTSTLFRVTVGGSHRLWVDSYH